MPKKTKHKRRAPQADADASSLALRLRENDPALLAVDSKLLLTDSQTDDTSLTGLLSKWRTEAVRNRFWPLPADYHTYTQEGRRQARIALLCNWTTPESTLLAWDAFCGFHLAHEDAQFYRDYTHPAPGHYGVIYDLCRNKFSMSAANRNFGKSVTMLSFLTAMSYAAMSWKRKTEVWYITSTHFLAQKHLDNIKLQWEFNPYLLDDYGIVKPTRNTGKWSSNLVRLEHGFQFIARSITSKNLGGRPDLLVLDDVEHDPEAKDNVDTNRKLTEALESKQFRTYRPMIMARNCCEAIIGTVRRLDSCLYRWMYSNDPRLSFFHRRLLGIVDDKGRKSWGEFFTDQTIANLRVELGDDFGSEMLNRITNTSPRSFAYDTAYHSFLISQEDDAWYNNPLESSTVLSHRLRHQKSSHLPAQWRSYKASDILPNMLRFMCVDFAGDNPSAHTDFHCAAVMALDHNACLWCLDLFADKCKQNVFMEAVVRLAWKWQVTEIGSESVVVQEELTDVLREILEDHFNERMGTPPSVIPLKGKDYQKDKSSRILTIRWRFERDRIFLPLNHLTEFPWSMLHHQIKSFNGDVSSLMNDDAVETVSMSTMLLRHRRMTSPETRIERSLVRERLNDPTIQHLALPVLSGIPTNQITNDDLAAIKEAQYNRDSARLLGRMGLPGVETPEEDVEAALATAAQTLRRVGCINVLRLPSKSPTSPLLDAEALTHLPNKLERLRR